VAVVLVGQILFVLAARRSASTGGVYAQVIYPHESALAGLLARVLSTAVSPGDRSVPRVHITSLSRDRSQPGRKDLALSWAINTDLTFGTIGNGARVDAVALLRAIYTSGLPIASTNLSGTYFLPDAKGKSHERTVMRLSLDLPRAELITDAGWDELGPDVIWPMLRHTFVAPDFEPTQQE
jgi:hypothetical protein